MTAGGGKGPPGGEGGPVGGEGLTPGGVGTTAGGGKGPPGGEGGPVGGKGSTPVENCPAEALYTSRKMFSPNWPARTSLLPLSSYTPLPEKKSRKAQAQGALSMQDPIDIPGRN